MPEYTRSREIAAPADGLFAYLADVDNLPDVLPHLTAVGPPSDGHVEVATRRGAEEVRTEAWVRADATARRMEWGAPGQRGYTGHLEVEGDGSVSRVTITITTANEDADGVGGRIDRALTAIAERLEE